MTARLYCRYAAHPRWGRPALCVVVLHALSMIAVAAAPSAQASTNAVVLNFTGLSDSYGVPIGDYYLAVASVRDQITLAGPGVTANPGTWVAWSAHTVGVMLSSLTVATLLTAEASLFVGIVALALWVLKITVSTYWLAVIGAIAHAVAGAVVAVTTGLGLLVLAVPLGVLIGAATVKRGEAGRGWTMILTALTLPALSVAVLADPADAMYGRDGLLAFGRRVGFSVAEAATHNGSVGAGGGGEVGALTASLITHTVREPLQLWNFGHVVDRVGGCGAAWSAAVRGGAPDGPITAMASCGDRAAVTYAQHLDGTNVWIGVIFVLAAALLAVFMAVSGWAVLKVSVQAVWTTVILLPTLWLGAVPGAAQRRAVDVVWRFFRHGVEVMVYIVYVSVIGLAVQRIVSDPLPAALGGDSPFAHVLMMGAVSVVALLLLRHVRADLSGRARGRGLLGRGAEVAVGMGLQAAIGGAGSAALSGARGLRGRSGGGRSLTPWERLDAAADDARRVHGPPQPGVEPVPSVGGDTADGHAAPGGGTAQGTDGAGAAAGAGGSGEPATPAAAGSSSSEPFGVADIVEDLGVGPAGARAGRGSAGSRRSASPDGGIQPGTDDRPVVGSAVPGADEPAAVAPITDAGDAAGERGSAEPAPEEPAPPGEQDEPAPPPPTTVDAVDDTP